MWIDSGTLIAFIRETFHQNGEENAKKIWWEFWKSYCFEYRRPNMLWRGQDRCVRLSMFFWSFLRKINGDDLWVCASVFKLKVTISSFHLPWSEKCLPESRLCRASGIQSQCYSYIVPERKFRILLHGEDVKSPIPNDHIGKNNASLYSCSYIKQYRLL